MSSPGVNSRNTLQGNDFRSQTERITKSDIFEHSKKVTTPLMKPL